MLLKIAWRNIWRSKTRSLVVIGAIVVGIWSLVFILSFVRGIANTYLAKSIENQTSHVQVHHPKYKEDNDIKLIIPNADEMINQMAQDPMVENSCSRLLVNGMLASSTYKRGLVMKGINIDQEKKITKLKDKIIEGTYFETKSKNPMIISSELAEKMKVKLRSKVVFTFQDINGEINSAAFKIVGIFDSGNSLIDMFYAFARKEDMQRLSGMNEGDAHEIALLLNDMESNIDVFPKTWQAKYPNLLVQNYKDIAPDLELMKTQINLNLIIMTTIFMLALIFGIINTMLMAVLERLRELGMLMAIGMNKAKIFFMIVLETLLIAVVGAPIGLLFGYVTVNYLNKTGIDLSQWSQGLKRIGMSDLVRPELPMESYLTITFAILFTALLASIYPARKAIKLKPVEAMRKI